MHSWEEPYRAVLLQTDSARLHANVLEARSALEQRLLSPPGKDELCAIVFASAILDQIERQLLTLLSASPQ